MKPLPFTLVIVAGVLTLSASGSFLTGFDTLFWVSGGLAAACLCWVEALKLRDVIRRRAARRQVQAWAAGSPTRREVLADATGRAS